MALDLLKLVLTATSTTVLKPANYGFYHVVGADTTSTTFPLAATTFQNDAGATLTAGFPAVSSDGYYMVTINGVQQKRSVVSYGTTTLTLTFATAATIQKDQVIALQVVDYDPDTATALTT